MDAHDFDVRAVKKACVSIVSKDLKMIPFETMNLLYRDDKIKLLNEIIESNPYIWNWEEISKHYVDCYVEILKKN